jgi:hypothetical protein
LVAIAAVCVVKQATAGFLKTPARLGAAAAEDACPVRLVDGGLGGEPVVREERNWQLVDRSPRACRGSSGNCGLADEPEPGVHAMPVPPLQSVLVADRVKLMLAESSTHNPGATPSAAHLRPGLGLSRRTVSAGCRSRGGRPR